MSSDESLKLPPEFAGLSREEALTIAKAAKKLIQTPRKRVALRNMVAQGRTQISDPKQESLS